MSVKKIVLPLYFASMSTYGFYRGYNDLFDTTNVLFSDKKADLIIDKTMIGICSAIIFINPIFQPFIVYNLLRRTEKKIRGIELTKDDYQF